MGVSERSKLTGYALDRAEGMVSQICSFPETVHDEFVDCISQGLRYMRDAGWISIDVAPRDDYDDDIFDAEEYNKRKKGNPYAE